MPACPFTAFGGTRVIGRMQIGRAHFGRVHFGRIAFLKDVWPNGQLAERMIGRMDSWPNSYEKCTLAEWMIGRIAMRSAHWPNARLAEWSVYATSQSQSPL